MGILPQVLGTDKSYHNAISNIIAYLAEKEVELLSTGTRAYYQARAIISENC